MKDLFSELHGNAKLWSDLGIPNQSNSSNMLIDYPQIIDFDVKLDCGVNLQRGYVWTLQQKQEFIISILLGKKIPDIVCIQYGSFTRDKDVKVEIIDGKQRLTACLEFMQGKFSVKGCYFSDIVIWNGEQRKLSVIFTSKMNNALIFRTYFDYDKLIKDEHKILLFKSSNFLGTQQEVLHFESVVYAYENHKEKQA